jgi:N-acyl-D-amino-acid deacylase
MTKYGVPGAALAVAYNGRLVYSRGFGFADLATKQAVAPDSLFRIGSISKPFTAVAVLKLVEEGKLDLDAKAFKILDIQPPGGEVLDQRIWSITVRELLEHSGGLGRPPLDPMFFSTSVAKAVGAPAPASCETVISYMMMTGLLGFAPGTRFEYSNFGYCALGRIIERITGMGYEDYMRTEVLVPMGIVDMQSGHTQLAFRALNEVHYYDGENRTVQSVFQNVTEPVPYPYGGFYLEALDSVGGWIASAQDLVRFALSVDGARPPAYLRPETVDIMLARNSVLWPTGDHWYALGWEVTYPSWWHAGGVPGSAAMLVKMPNGVAWAVLFNTCCRDTELFSDADQSLRTAFNQTNSWPSWDLFQTEISTSSTASSHHSALTETITPAAIPLLV